MKIQYTSMGIIVLILLQACSSQPTQSNASETSEKIPDAGKSQLINASFKADPSQQLSVPEVQIIRELYQSGCLIEEIKLNRRKQQMTISCVNDEANRSSI